MSTPSTSRGRWCTTATWVTSCFFFLLFLHVPFALGSPRPRRWGAARTVAQVDNLDFLLEVVPPRPEIDVVKSKSKPAGAKRESESFTTDSRPHSPLPTTT